MNNRRVWLAIAFAMAGNFLILLAQTVVSMWKWRHLGPLSCLWPESRYYLQELVLLIPLLPMAMLRFRHGSKVLAVILLLLVMHASVYLLKANIPGTRRCEYVAACNWAVETIRADYKGPKADARPFFSWLEYHSLARPCIDAHVSRVAYLLGGRSSSYAGCGVVDTPDYIVDERCRVNRDWWWFAKFEILAEKKFGKRDFVIFKRIK